MAPRFPTASALERDAGLTIPEMIAKARALFEMSCQDDYTIPLDRSY